MRILKKNIQHEACFLEPNSLEGWPPTPIERTIFPLLTYLNLLKCHKRKWVNEEKNDYSLVVIENGPIGINVKKIK